MSYITDMNDEIEKDAQGAQAVDERELFNRAYEEICNRPITIREIARRMWMARAALATQPAASEPVEIEVPTFSHEGMGCGLEDRGITDRYEAMEYGYNEALEQQWAIINSHGPLFAAPPAAAHGDEAVRKDAERYAYLRDMTEGLDATVDAMIAENAAMRAQAGEGGE